MPTKPKSSFWPSLSRFYSVADKLRASSACSAVFLLPCPIAGYFHSAPNRVSEIHLGKYLGQYKSR